MTEQLLKAKAKDIATMGREELNSFVAALSISFVNDKSKFYLYKEIDKRRAKLENVVSPMAESAEIDYDY